jgi:hypothetical protein
MIWVTNTSNEFLVQHWDGKAISFPPNKPVQLSLELAQIIFGYGLEDKATALVRLGWVKFSNDIPAALEKLRKFVISETQPQTYHNVSPVVERVPPLASRREGGKPSK